MSLLGLIHRLPDLVVLVSVVLCVTGGMMLAPLLALRVFRFKVGPATSDAAWDAFKSAIAILGVVLAFSLVQVTANLRTGEALVGREAAAFAATDRALIRTANPSVLALRPLLAAYGESIVADEWPALANGDRSAVTDRSFHALNVGFRTLQPEPGRQTLLFEDVFRKLDELSDVRESIIMFSDIALPGFFWTVIGLFLVMVFVSAMMTCAHPKYIVAVGIGGAAVGFLLAFVVIVDQPFSGQTSVGSEPIQKMLVLNRARN